MSKILTVASWPLACSVMSNNATYENYKNKTIGIVQLVNILYLLTDSSEYIYHYTIINEQNTSGSNMSSISTPN